ncbi:unnamed protein product [marine sediment metagenome]|uniref:Uncharacterized protein n=1 Tax=marine sediment metagenome TaxID=412755 RepID=X1FRN9_9ZZZZ
MTRRISVFIPILLILLFLPTRCAWFTPAEQDLIVKITARRFAAHGARLFPETFADLGKTATDACTRPGETLTPAAALEMIAEAVGLQLGDRLLAADLKDLAALIGIRFDAAFKLIGVTQEQERLIKIAVCSFAEGVDLYP